MRRTVGRLGDRPRTRTLATDARHAVLAALAALSTFNPDFVRREGVVLVLVAALPDLLAQRIRRTDAWAVAFAALMCVSLLWSSVPPLTVAASLDQVAAAIIFVALRSAMFDRRALTIIATGFLGGCVYSLWSLLRTNPQAQLTLAVDVTNRFALAGLNTNYTAYALAAGLGVAVLMTQRRRLGWVCGLVGVALAYAGIVLTGSRGGLLAAFATVVWVLVPRRLRRPAGWVLYAVVTFGAIGTFTGWTDGLLRANVGAVDNRDPGQISGRLDVWPLARAAFSDHVWLGTGGGTFPAMNSDGIYAHNVLLDVGSGLGLVGLIVILTLFYNTLVVSTRHADPATRALLLGVAVCCLAPPLLTGYWFQAMAAWVALALFSRMEVVAPRSQDPHDATSATATVVEAHGLQRLGRMPAH